MKSIRLNENDLARIVRRVLREEEEMGGESFPPMGRNKSDCFSNARIRIPSSCRVKPMGGPIGTPIGVSQQCISEIGDMMTMKNLTEVTKVLGCIAKQSVTSFR